MTDLTQDLNNAANPEAPKIRTTEDYEAEARACDFTLLHSPSLKEDERSALIAKLKDDAAHNAKGAIPHAAMALTMARNLTATQKRDLISIFESCMATHPDMVFFSTRDILHFTAKRRLQNLDAGETTLLSSIRDKALALCKDWKGEPLAVTLKDFPETAPA